MHKNDRLDDDASSVIAAIGGGPRLVVVGSTSFQEVDSRLLCRMIAGELALIAPLIAVTGGMNGVGITFGNSFAAARKHALLSENLFHLLPRGSEPCEVGVTLEAGGDLKERREIIGRIGNVCLVIEGGSGTEHEATVAMSLEIPIIPVGRTGGHAGELFSDMPRPDWAPSSLWAILGNTRATPREVALAVRQLVETAIA